MEDIILFCVEVVLSLAASIFILIYLGGLLKSMLDELCGTKERGAFWFGFSKLVFIFLPLLVVIYYGDGYCAKTGVTSQMLRDMASRVIFGELITLATIGFVLWRTISSKNRKEKQTSLNLPGKEVL